ncbi:uncharacterized protein [Miscanthus floridulus]|uniref:uncharacterized protein n=1 Tax=Miscanthus floridulus TaxID=154761 RepID=UPI0034579F97
MTAKIPAYSPAPAAAAASAPAPATLASSMLSRALLVATSEPPDLLLSARGEQPFQGQDAVYCFEGFCMTLALETSMADRRETTFDPTSKFGFSPGQAAPTAAVEAPTAPLPLPPLAAGGGPDGAPSSPSSGRRGGPDAGMEAPVAAADPAQGHHRCPQLAFGACGYLDFDDANKDIITVCALLSFLLPTLFHLRVNGDTGNACRR